jgi:hypothetical protein
MEPKQGWWLMSIILATWEVAIKRTEVQEKHRQKVHEASISTSGCGGVHLSSQLCEKHK